MSDAYDRGMKVRRAVLGDAHVDRAAAGVTDLNREFQDLITRYAWGEIWTRPGLDRKTRSCMVLSTMIALRHWDEFRMHVNAAFNNGLGEGGDQGSHPAIGHLLRRAFGEPRLQGGRGGHRRTGGEQSMSTRRELAGGAGRRAGSTTAATLQMWSQIVGKVRLARSPRENHWWHVALYLTARGLTTSPMPDGSGAFQIDFDFIDHALVIATSDGRREDDARSPTIRSVAEFYAAFMARLAALYDRRRDLAGAGRGSGRRAV